MIRREFRLAEGDAFNAAAVRAIAPAAAGPRLLQRRDRHAVAGLGAGQGDRHAVVDEKATGELTLGGGYSTDAGALVNAGLRERNLIGTGIDASLNGVLAQKRSQIDLSVTDPYFLDRNLVAGFDLFHVRNNNQDIAAYSERRTGGALRLGYEFNEHLRQAWTYSLVDRNVYNVAVRRQHLHHEPGRHVAAVAARHDADARLPRQPDRPACRLHVRLGVDFAGIGGTRATCAPSSTATTSSRWKRSPATRLEHRALGRRRLPGAARPRGEDHRPVLPGRRQPARLPVRRRRAACGPRAPARIDSIGGRLIYTQSTELRFPLPISADLGLSGRAFVDVGSLSQVDTRSRARVVRHDADAAGRRRRRRVLEDAVRPDQHRPRAGRGETQIRPDPAFPVWFRNEVLSLMHSACFARGLAAGCSPARVRPSRSRSPGYFIPPQAGRASRARPAAPGAAAPRPAPRRRASRRCSRTRRARPIAGPAADEAPPMQVQLPPAPTCRRCRRARRRRPP